VSGSGTSPTTIPGWVRVRTRLPYRVLGVVPDPEGLECKAIIRMEEKPDARRGI
jgi:hypothetical protein